MSELTPHPSVLSDRWSTSVARVFFLLACGPKANACSPCAAADCGLQISGGGMELKCRPFKLPVMDLLCPFPEQVPPTYLPTYPTYQRTIHLSPLARPRCL
eukprot:2770228-Rhodomonas_salina.2